MWVINNIHESIFYQCAFVGSLHKCKQIFTIVFIYDIVVQKKILAVTLTTNFKI